MSKSHRTQHHHKAKPAQPVARRSSDMGVYLGLLMIGVFGVLLSLVTFEGHWQEATVAFIAVIAFMVNIDGWRAYKGMHLAGWQQSLARIPLRFVGYGTETGHPLEAAKDEPRVKKAMFICGVVSLLIVAGATVLLIRPLPGF